jgi:hypothetical protein
MAGMTDKAVTFLFRCNALREILAWQFPRQSRLPDLQYCPGPSMFLASPASRWIADDNPLLQADNEEHACGFSL